ncbi:CDP-alcohol phosphatidyltransferase-domain-containing protein [Gigaspora rosea]|uniref:CDP-alcohol phosphatidyltransferase-domain-containing protein n=1 Tax=Gigaspora rosea TaxID=44941 RepID=A0A397U4T0_9GLOM|nr:CDP-alcohol phosphatidyltransferase-domain-containing protein [Gigaspora rosea]
MIPSFEAQSFSRGLVFRRGYHLSPGGFVIFRGFRLSPFERRLRFSSFTGFRFRLTQFTKIVSSNKYTKKKFKKIPLRETILNLPNVLTLSRLIVSPFVGYFILNEQYEIALGVFVYAGVTDLLDGIIARRYNLKTMAGTVIDPLADKTLMTILTITLAMKDLLPIPVATIILGRDICLILASFYYRYISLPSPRTLSRYFDMSIPSAEVRPTLISKVNTALQLALMGTTLASPIFGWINVPFLKALQYTVTGTTIWSGVSYVLSKDAIRILKQPRIKRH